MKRFVQPFSLGKAIAGAVLLFLFQCQPVVAERFLPNFAHVQVAAGLYPDYTANRVPVIAGQPINQTVVVGESATFAVSASGNPAPRYQWQRNGVSMAGATSTSYTLVNPALSDNGATFKVIVSNSAGVVLSNEVTLTVVVNELPVATITTPVSGASYSGGDVIFFSGMGTDKEEGDLPASSFTWKVDLYHFDPPAHVHPVLEPRSGITAGSFTVPVEMETSANVLFRLFLTVVDSKGATRTVSRDVVPVTSTITVATSPAGLRVKLDGRTVTTPYSFTGVNRIVRVLEALSPQTVGNTTYTFASWSNAGPRLQNLSTPGVDSTLTANFVPSTDGRTSLVTSGVHEFDPVPSALRQGVDTAMEAPDALWTNPNPFTTETTITFHLPAKTQRAAIQIHNVQGQLLRIIDVSANPEGRIQVNRKGLAAGIYVCSLVVDGAAIATKRLVVN